MLIRVFASIYSFRFDVIAYVQHRFEEVNIPVLPVIHDEPSHSEVVTLKSLL